MGLVRITHAHHTRVSACARSIMKCIAAVVVVAALFVSGCSRDVHTAKGGIIKRTELRQLCGRFYVAQESYQKSLQEYQKSLQEHHPISDNPELTQGPGHSEVKRGFRFLRSRRIHEPAPPDSDAANIAIAGTATGADANVRSRELRRLYKEKSEQAEERLDKIKIEMRFHRVMESDCLAL